MSTNSPPSVILTDALASLNKAVNIAFASIQDQARQEVTLASTEGREARRERDEAVKALHDCRLEEQAWRQEAGVWKAAVEQAELTIKHHLDTISQLRHEAEQWKQQCLRLEDTSRQEAISWKEQFLRVEQERYKLSTRVDELVEEQLSYTGQTHASNTPITPMFRHPNAATCTTHLDSSASAHLHRSPFVYGDSLSAPISKATKPISAQQLPTPISENRRATGDKPKQFLIRRVQATIEVPVKEESEEKTVSDQAHSASCSSVSSSILGPAPTAPGPSRPPTSANASKTILTSKTAAKPSKAVPEPNKPASSTGKSAPGRNKPTSASSKSTSTSGKPATGPSKSTVRPSKPTLSGTGNKPSSNPTTSTPASSRPHRKVSTKRQYVEIDDEVEEDEISEPSGSGSDVNVGDEGDPSEEEDELMMGAEENRREVYGTKRIVTASSMKAVSSAPAKKRKLALSLTALTASTGKKPPGKNARG
ncbi:hypothetical protein AZE42_00170 [Rhizopogon vesiculosus]|uniref:Uncharacterized protein n=1 Tax=Rhizopogon vesiculosus TaxID=180088 RepID=A0A1J8Q868_9AGAM|nr:hypothetical protein AZE42_00170 [Rhizopogon vesiculosus]